MKSKKLRLNELSVNSFVVKEKIQIKGGWEYTDKYCQATDFC